jgi:deoxyribodipyrimidine photo-lyase
MMLRFQHLILMSSKCEIGCYIFFANNIVSYEEERNFSDLESTSQLSFWLAVGAIPVRRCYLIALDMATLNSASWLNELIWRDFYRVVMWRLPHVSKHHAFKSGDRDLRCSHHLEPFEKWKRGETGILIIDVEPYFRVFKPAEKV